MADAFTIDDAYDRDHASDGVSRYGTYLGIRATWFSDEPFGGEPGSFVTDPVDFADAAWAVASSPNMAPGYVTSHPLILSADTRRSMEDGSLQADVALIVPVPPPELRALPGWSSWATQSGQYVEPSPAALARRPAMLTTVQLLFCLSPERLYVPEDAPERLTVHDAKASVRRVAELLNAIVEPVLGQLEGGR